MSKQEIFVIVETPTKVRNLGTIIRCCVGFGVTAICIYGFDSYSTHGAHGAQRHIPVLHFYYLQDCINFLKYRNCLAIYSISPIKMANNLSTPIEGFRFPGSCAFIVASGRENDAFLTNEQIQHSDSILHIHVPNIEYEDMLHYNVKLSICLQTFAVQAGFKPVEFEGEKHIICEASNVSSKEIIQSHASYTISHCNYTAQDSSGTDDGADLSELFSST
jgi:tRNA(Leu) C34 or U34 (ribose-2'-O)-methylase TrmL